MALVRAANPTPVTHAQIEPDGMIRFFNGDEVIHGERAWLRTYRQRDKGDKALVSIPVGKGSLGFGDGRALDQYDYIFSIDTNSHEMAGRKVSLAQIAQCRPNEQGAEYDALMAFEFHNATENPEKTGWFLLEQAILASADYDASKRYAIITDTDFAKHDEYNGRVTPYFRDQLLPPNFTLIYGSEEGRSWVNVLVKYCDKESNRVLKEIRSGVYPVNEAMEVSDAPFSHFRGYFNNNPTHSQAGWFCLAHLSFSSEVA
jgi:hypothetical protein